MDKDAFNKLREQAGGRRIVLKLRGGEQLTVLPSDIVSVHSTHIELKERLLFFSSDLDDASLV